MRSDSAIIAKERKRDDLVNAIIFIEGVILVSVLFFFCVFIAQYSTGAVHEDGGIEYEVYEGASNRLRDNSLIVEIGEECEDNANPVRCVFDKINEPYDESRVGQSIPFIRTPSDYSRLGGVCRDHAVLRKAALDNIGINCMYDFSTPRHVFLVCNYNGRFYELNNGRFIYR